MIFDKIMRISYAANKTISEGKQFTISDRDTGRHWMLTHMNGELMKAFCMTLYCTYALSSLVGWACVCPLGFILLTKGVDSLSRKWRDDT